MLGRTAMNETIERVVIVGGGTAGWLAAARLASSPRAVAGRLSVTLIEAPDIPTIGVGEGSWPTIRATLAAIGIGEGEFLADRKSVVEGKSVSVREVVGVRRIKKKIMT